MTKSETEDFERKELDLHPLQNMRQPVLFVVGGPGSGKATQCRKIAEEFKLHHISMGQVIKDRLKKTQTAQSSALQATFDSGGIISLDEVMEILETEMLRLMQIESRPFIIHGFPRYIFQAIEYERDIGFPRTIIFLNCNLTVMRNRLNVRKNDDSSTQIEKRLLQFNAILQEVLNYYEPHKKLYVVRQLHQLKNVNGNNSIDEVYKDMAQIVELWT